jgi:hypothetical protein
MKRLVVHVGLPKAASTTIQTWAYTNREHLAARDIHYPETVASPLNPKHQRLVYCLENPGVPMWSPWADHHAETVFLSAEALSGHLDGFYEAALAKFRDCHSRRVSIFLNTRDREPWLESFWRQKLFNQTDPRWCNGTDIPLAEFSNDPRVKHLLDPNLPQRIADAFGAEEIVVGKLEEAWAEDLCQLLGIKELAESLRSARPENRGFSLAAAEITRQVNSQKRPAHIRAQCLAAVEQLEGTFTFWGSQYALQARKDHASLSEAIDTVRRVEPGNSSESQLRLDIIAHLESLRASIKPTQLSHRLFRTLQELIRVKS